MAKLTLIRGLPGSGKSSFARAAFPGVVNFENDQFHMRAGRYDFDVRRQSKAVSWCLDMTDATLATGCDVVVSNTFTKPGYVEAYRKLAEKNGAELDVYLMHGRFENQHRVPAQILENMAKNLKPWLGEKHVYPYEIGGEREYAVIPFAEGDSVKAKGGVEDGKVGTVESIKVVDGFVNVSVRFEDGLTELLDPKDCEKCC